MVGRLSSAKNVSIIAVSAALYGVFFFLSYVVPSPSPSFVLLYLPVILLGVFPLWFGWPGLVGSMVGAVIGGVFVESLAFFAWVEAVTTLIIYSLNWVLMPRDAAERNKKNLVLLFGVYALTLFLGTSYIVWQLTIVGTFTAEVASVILLPTFTINYLIEAVTCPVLLRALSPKLRSWGMYTGNFWEWRRKRKSKVQL